MLSGAAVGMVRQKSGRPFKKFGRQLLDLDLPTEFSIKLYREFRDLPKKHIKVVSFDLA